MAFLVSAVAMALRFPAFLIKTIFENSLFSKMFPILPLTHSSLAVSLTPCVAFVLRENKNIEKSKKNIPLKFNKWQ
jgi:hypothetical protein